MEKRFVRMERPVAIQAVVTVLGQVEDAPRSCVSTEVFPGFIEKEQETDNMNPIHGMGFTRKLVD